MLCSQGLQAEPVDDGLGLQITKENQPFLEQLLDSATGCGNIKQISPGATHDNKHGSRSGCRLRLRGYMLNGVLQLPRS